MLEEAWCPLTALGGSGLAGEQGGRAEEQSRVAPSGIGCEAGAGLRLPQAHPRALPKAGLDSSFPGWLGLSSL